MKKFTETVGIVRELNEKELSALQKSYREYFAAKMKKFEVGSPAELNDEQKKEFFNEITKDWERGKGATDAGKKDVEDHGVKESVSTDVNESLLVVGGIILAVVGLKALRGLAKDVFVKIGKTVEQEPAKLKELVNKIYDDAVSDIAGSDKSKADAWKEDLLNRIDAGEIKNLKDIEASLNNSNIFESEEVNEAKINEKDIKSKADFADFAEAKLKKAFGDDYDEAKAKKVIDGLSAEAEKSGDWGAAIGKLNKA